MAGMYAALLFNTGCTRAPSFNILGSFFPSWILCGVIGIVLTVVVRVFLVRAKLAAGVEAVDCGVSMHCLVFHIHDVAAVLQLIQGEDSDAGKYNS